jgi:hypothetical protein
MQDTSLFPCVYRGEQTGEWDCRCQAKAPIYPCTHPDNGFGQATRYRMMMACGGATFSGWSCSECLIHGKISMQTGLPPGPNEVIENPPTSLYTPSPITDSSKGRAKLAAVAERERRIASGEPPLERFKEGMPPRLNGPRVSSTQAPRPCHCDRAGAGTDYSPDQCLDCWRVVNNPGWALHWGVPPEKAPTSSLYRRGTFPIPRPAVRHLAYHVAPFAGTGIWRHNITQLLSRIHLFNGKRVVAIATGPGLDPPDMVKDALGEAVHEYIVLPNQSTLREVVTFLPLLERIESTDSREITFYAHTKGVTRPVDNSTTVHAWTTIMYETCLNYVSLVESLLETHPIVGTFKKLGAGFPGSRSSWHYSGTFYWLRNADVFSRPWRVVDQEWWGTESWPGLHFLPAEAGKLFLEGTVPEMNLYDQAFLQTTVRQLAEWKKVHGHFSGDFETSSQEAASSRRELDPGSRRPTLC